jgi:hypothetical protein
MTLVCVRLDESYSTPRWTALADTRATVPATDHSLKTVADTTVKLFAIPVRCYRIDADTLTPVIGAWREPYFETKVGLGFSGHCFEALMIVEHVRRLIGALGTPIEGRPLPCKEGLIHLIAKATENYFASHSGEGNPALQMVLFGFDKDRPWIGKVSWDRRSGLRFEVDWANRDTLIAIGASGAFEQRARDWRRRVQKHKAKIAARRAAKPVGDDADFAKEVSGLDVAYKKIVEEEMLAKIDSEFVHEIGGVLQRLELGSDGGKVVAGFTQDDRPYLQGVSVSVAKDALLGPIPIIEKMGRMIRTPKKNRTGTKTP